MSKELHASDAQNECEGKAKESHTVLPYAALNLPENRGILLRIYRILQMLIQGDTSVKLAAIAGVLFALSFNILVLKFALWILR